MKKWICGMLAAVLLVPVLATTAFASGHGKENHSHGDTKSHTYNAVCQTNKPCEENKTCQNQQVCAASCTYADVNGDNICDNCKNICAQCGAAKDENRDGICDDCGQCSHYQDADDDSVCDHQQQCVQRQKPVQQHTPRKVGHHSRGHKNHH